VTLRQIIEQEIAEKGPIPFSRYMELCLYHPELGYYSRNAEQFGKAGDFFTSSDVHAVFGRLLARQFDEVWRMLGMPQQIEILELGPGRGLFARDVLDWSKKKFPEFFKSLHYSLAEQSPSLRDKLKQNLKTHLESGQASLLEHNGVEQQNNREGTASAVLLEPKIKRALAPEVPVIIFANEFFDAIPVEVVSNQGKLNISCSAGRFAETWTPASDDELKFLEDYSIQPLPHERLEISKRALNLMAQIANTIQTGIFITLDYGYTQPEQKAGRHRGTLKAIRQHSVSASPYEAPGEQDITADINFTALAAVAEQNGMIAQPLRTQSQFLMGIGEKNQFADAFEECRLPQERAKVALQLKHLVTPAGMGESFHVMVASKGIDPETVAKLSGLSFGNRNG
jgi:SAM-dependent MidA family methyltransferase